MKVRRPRRTTTTEPTEVSRVLWLDVTLPIGLRRRMMMDRGADLLGYVIPSHVATKYGLLDVMRGMARSATSVRVYDHESAGTFDPEVAARHAEAWSAGGVTHAVVRPMGGPAVLDAYLDELARYGITPIVGPVLAYKTTEEGGWNYTTLDCLVDESGEQVCGYVYTEAGDAILDRALARGCRHVWVDLASPDILRHVLARIEDAHRELKPEITVWVQCPPGYDPGALHVEGYQEMVLVIREG